MYCKDCKFMADKSGFTEDENGNKVLRFDPFILGFFHLLSSNQSLCLLRFYYLDERAKPIKKKLEDEGVPESVILKELFVEQVFLPAIVQHYDTALPNCFEPKESIKR